MTKCKCQRVFLVVVDKTQPNSKWCNFLLGLKDAGCKPCRNVYEHINVDPSSKCWTVCVGKKIAALTEEHGRKPYLVSGLYDADLEAQLIQFALKVCKILLATTIEDISLASENAELLPVNAQCEKFTTVRYAGAAGEGTTAVNVYGPDKLPGEGTYLANTSVASVIGQGAFIGDKMPEDLLPGDTIVIAPTDPSSWGSIIAHAEGLSLSDSSAYAVAAAYNSSSSKLKWDTAARTLSVCNTLFGPSACTTIGIIHGDDKSSTYADDFFAAGGILRNPDNTLEPNQLRVLGSRLCWWLKCQ